MGYATPEGEDFLVTNRAAADELLSRVAEGTARMAPLPIVRAMENLKLALKLRLKQGPIDQSTAHRIAAALDEAARNVERS